MIKVTSLKARKNNQYLVGLSNNNKPEFHTITLENVMAFHLEEGITLSKQQYNQLVQRNTHDVLMKKALVFIEYQMRTISEVKKRLRKETNDEVIIQKVIDHLKQLQYLSDARYVEEYIKEKIAFDLVGPRNIKEKLIGKGIHFDLIDSFLVQYTQEVEYQKVYELIQKEIRLPIRQARYKFFNSFKRKLINKGFNMAVIDASLASFKEDIITKINDKPLLEKEFQALQKKHDVKEYKEREKIKQKLLQKGFDYAMIQQIVK